MTEEWRCAGCGKTSPDRRRCCECPTGVVFNNRTSAWKIEQPEMSPERHALLWAFDRLTTDNLTAKEIKKTADEIGNVLRGRASVAATYIPMEWTDAGKIEKQST